MEKMTFIVGAFPCRATSFVLLDGSGKEIFKTNSFEKEIPNEVKNKIEYLLRDKPIELSVLFRGPDCYLKTISKEVKNFLFSYKKHYTKSKIIFI